MSENMQVVRKLSTKTIVGNVKPLIANATDKVFLYFIGGKAIGVKKGESNYGAWTAFTGDFVAKTHKETYRSSKAFLPPVVSDPIEAAFKDTGEEIEFAFNIFVKKNDTPVGYEYVCEPVIKIRESDALAAIMEKAILPPANTAPALPAPKGEDKKDDKKGKKK